MIVGCNFYSLDEFSQPPQQTYLIQLQLLYVILVLDTAEARNGGAIITFTLKIDKCMTAKLKKKVIIPVNTRNIFRSC
jgi:hypothetical protein